MPSDKQLEDAGVVTLAELFEQAPTKRILDEVCLRFIAKQGGPAKFAQALKDLADHPDCPFSTRVRIYDIVLQKRWQIEEKLGHDDISQMSKEQLEKEAERLLKRIQIRATKPQIVLARLPTAKLEEELERRRRRAEEENRPFEGTWSNSSE